MIGKRVQTFLELSRNALKFVKIAQTKLLHDNQNYSIDQMSQGLRSEEHDLKIFQTTNKNLPRQIDFIGHRYFNIQFVRNPMIIHCEFHQMEQHKIGEVFRSNSFFGIRFPLSSRRIKVWNISSLQKCFQASLKRNQRSDNIRFGLT